ncbi:unnamed protein product [Penicillium manginii]
MDSGPSAFGSNVTKVLSSLWTKASHSLAIEKALPDYASFMSYVISHHLRFIPRAELLLKDQIGCGAFMVVYKAICPLHLGTTSLAVKRVRIATPQWSSEVTRYTHELREMLELMSLELRVLSNDLLRHNPNIVRMLGVSWEEINIPQEGDGKCATFQRQPTPSIAPILVLEQASCTLKELYDDIARQARPRLSLDVKVSLWCDVANALSAVHWLGVIHGDVKPENILIFQHPTSCQLTAKLSDFGGCQPVPDEEATGVDSRLLGTEYWNAPEAYDENNPYFRKTFRDYYSFGMVGAYIIFEKELFGPAKELTEEQKAHMRESKESYQSIAHLIEEKLWTTHSFVRSRHAQETLSSLPRSGNGFDRFKHSYKQIKPAIVVSSYPLRIQVVDSHDNRIFAMCFAMTRFLHFEPEKRDLDKLLGDLKAFIKDLWVSRGAKFHVRSSTDVEYRKVGQALAKVFGAKCWHDVLDLSLKDFNIWNISAAAENQNAKLEPRLRIISKVQTATTPFDYVGHSLNPEVFWLGTYVPLYSDVYNVPHSLQKELADELEHRALATKGIEKAEYLVALGISKARRREISIEEWWVILSEAAQKGSISAKWTIIHLESASFQPEKKPWKDCERNQWLLELVLLPEMRIGGLLTKLQQAVPDYLTESLLFEDLRDELLLLSAEEWPNPGLDETPFANAFRAIAAADTKRLRRILDDHRGKLLWEKQGGHTLLHYAAILGQHELALFLIREYEVDIDLETDDGATAISLAAIHRQTKTMNALVNAGANVQYILTPRVLRLVANDGFVSTLRLISEVFKARTVHQPTQHPGDPGPAAVKLQAFLDGDISSNLDKQSDSEPTFSPIFAAILGNNALCLQALLSMGCSTSRYMTVESRTTTGSACEMFSVTPIHLAASQLRPWHLTALLEYGVDPELRTDDEYKQVPLHLACVAYQRITYKFPDVVTGDMKFPPSDSVDITQMIAIRLFMINMLVKVYGAAVDAQDAIGRTALFFCMGMPHCLQVMQYLVRECEARINLKDHTGQTCLHHAALLSPDPTYIEFCIASGSTVNERDYAGATPLLYAEQREDKSFSQLLRSHGAFL